MGSNRAVVFIGLHSNNALPVRRDRMGGDADVAFFIGWGYEHIFAECTATTRRLSRIAVTMSLYMKIAYGVARYGSAATR